MQFTESDDDDLLHYEPQFEPSTPPRPRGPAIVSDDEDDGVVDRPGADDRDASDEEPRRPRGPAIVSDDEEPADAAAAAREPRERRPMRPLRRARSAGETPDRRRMRQADSSDDETRAPGGPLVKARDTCRRRAYLFTWPATSAAGKLSPEEFTREQASARILAAHTKNGVTLDRWLIVAEVHSTSCTEARHFHMAIHSSAPFRWKQIAADLRTDRIYGRFDEFATYADAARYCTEAVAEHKDEEELDPNPLLSEFWR